MSPWRPGGYAAKLELEQPYEDVPEHLLRPLLEWFEQACDDDTLRYLLNHHRITDLTEPAGPRFGIGAVDQLTPRLATDHGLLLNMIETLLDWETVHPEEIEELKTTLDIGNSAYDVAPDGKSLQMRVMPEVSAAVQDVVTSAASVGSTAQHLATAWNAAYGRQSDAGKAYDEAIKAVEGAAIPVVSPKKADATLGTVRGELKANPSQWTFVISDGRTGASMERVVAMISLLWEGDEDRHAGTEPTPQMSGEAAKAAVHLAATLVQWFTSGAIRKKRPSAI